MSKVMTTTPELGPCEVCGKDAIWVCWDLVESYPATDASGRLWKTWEQKEKHLLCGRCIDRQDILEELRKAGFYNKEILTLNGEIDKTLLEEEFNKL